MRRPLACLLVLAAGVQVALAADNPDLSHGIRLLDQAEDEAALQAFKRALARPKLRRAQRVKVQLYLGITYLNLVQVGAARDHFRAALKLDPRAELPGGVSPKIEEFFTQVKAELVQSSRRARPPHSGPPPAPPPSPPRAADSRPSAWSYWPAWVAVGLGVAAGGAGLGLAIRARDRTDEANDLTLPTSEAETRHDSARKMALSANILFGVAGAAAIAAGILFYLGSRRSSTTAGVLPVESGALVQLSVPVW